MPSLGLVLDLSHTGFAAVLSADGETVLASQVRQGGTRHDDLGDWLESLLKDAGSGGGWKDLGWICVGLGPGSFTGIRIGMAFAQGVALPGKIPLHGFTSFEALFLSAPEGRAAVAAIAANAGRFYLARGLEDPGVLTSAEALADAAGNATVLTPADASWDYPRIARHALSSKRDARKPYYLQLSAAEDKAAADQVARGS
ncbi:MAG: tsaB [Fibrobacteria bacterium]|jgi:tRNA threonylcarbamoyladenosine biosynthesis protein TsaB|nr:tsaB [Fibrobacteria bacterium]